jgi:hypothetical protein
MSNFHRAIWLLPWDLVDEGADYVLKNIQEAGIKTINLAIQYHCGRFSLPHNPKHKFYYAEEGAAYFTPHQKYYHTTCFQPPKSKQVKKDALQLAVDANENYGFSIIAWFIGLHNAVLCSQNPNSSIVNIFGERDPNQLCPNDTDAREFLKSLVKDVASNYPIDGIETESFCLPWSYIHEEHHENLHAKLDPLAHTLLNTCYCDKCIIASKNYGFDLAQSKKTAKKILTEWFHFPPYRLSKIGLNRQVGNLLSIALSHPEIKDLLIYRGKLTATIHSEIREILKNVSVKLRLYSISIWPYSLSWYEGIDIKRLSQYVDAVEILSYVKSPHEVFHDTYWSKKMLNDKCLLHTGIRAIPPAADDPAILKAQIRSAKEAEADGICFFHYGQMPLTQLSIIKDGLQEIGVL